MKASGGPSVGTRSQFERRRSGRLAPSLALLCVWLAYRLHSLTRRAFKRSRDRLPPEVAEPKVAPPPKPPRTPKVEKLPKPLREIYQPQGALGRLIAAKADAVGLRVSDLRVMSAKRDPYTLDTLGNHLNGRWFSDQVARFAAEDVTVHLRGLHYLLSSTAIVRPDGRPYVPPRLQLPNLSDFHRMLHAGITPHGRRPRRQVCASDARALCEPFKPG
jgi:hypothetical protein